MQIDRSIRPAFYDDESSVVEIFNQGIEERTNAYLKPLDWIPGADWYKSLRNNAAVLIVCEVNGALAGWASLTDYRSGREALAKTKEITFYVHRDFRNKGVASGMIEYLEEECSTKGYKHLVAILLDSNVASRALLEKHGYFVWGLFEDIAEFEDECLGHLYMGKRIIVHR